MPDGMQTPMLPRGSALTFKVSVHGLQGIALELLKLARQGLSRRGLGEEDFLQPLDDIASSGKTLADQLLERYHQQWHGDVDRAYSPELTY